MMKMYRKEPLFSCKAIFLDKTVHRPCRNPLPHRKTHIYHKHISPTFYRSGNLPDFSLLRLFMFPSYTTVLIRPIQICIYIWLYRIQIKQFSTSNLCYLIATYTVFPVTEKYIMMAFLSTSSLSVSFILISSVTVSSDASVSSSDSFSPIFCPG